MRASADVVDNGLLIEDRYRLRERLGQGGMSVVWRAEDDVLGREVAVKVLAAQLAADPELLSRIRSEARAAAALRHANIVEVYDYGETGFRGHTLPFVVMELVDGRSLADLLSGGSLPWRLAVVICAQVAAALAAAHASGIVHRDVKPGNVMVTAAGVKLVDFGISAAVGAIDGTDGQVLGTPAYLAPERISGGPVRPATDVYALGLLLYLTLAGRLPWQASTSTQMLKAHCYLDPAPLPAVPGLPSQVARMVRRCLAKTPGDRPSAAEVAEVLGEIAGLPPARLLHTVAGDGARTGMSRPVGLGSTAATVARTLRTPGRRRLVVAGGAAAAVVAAGAVSWFAGTGGGGPDPAAAAAQPRPGCAVRYAIRSVTGGRASTAVTIRNTGQVAVPAWQLSFTLPQGQRLVRGWTGGWRQEGVAVRAGGGELPVGGSVATGFDAAYRDATALPASFELNGVACEAEMSVQGPSPAPAASAVGGNGSSGRTTSAAGSSGGGSSGSGTSGSGSSGSGSSAGGSSGNGGEGSKSAGKAKEKDKDKAKDKDKPKEKD